MFRITSPLQNVPSSQEKIKKKAEKKVSYIAKYTGNVPHYEQIGFYKEILDHFLQVKLYNMLFFLLYSFNLFMAIPYKCIFPAVDFRKKTKKKKRKEKQKNQHFNVFIFCFFSFTDIEFFFFFQNLTKNVPGRVMQNKEFTWNSLMSVNLWSDIIDNIQPW